MEQKTTKGITYRKDRKSWQAQIKIKGININLGLFKYQKHAIERYMAAKNAIDNGIPIYQFLEVNPNKKNYHSTVNTFENEYNSWLDDIEREPSSKDGYHFKLGFCVTNYNILQKRYANRFQGKVAIFVEEVPWFDFSGEVFRDKKMNFKYWKDHLAKVGVCMAYCNHDMTELEIKNALFRVFQRNIHIPKSMKIDYYKIGEELDQLVQEAIYTKPMRKPKIVNKVIFNPNFSLSKQERKSISIEFVANKKSDNMLKKLKKHYMDGISKKALNRASGVSLPTIRKYWEELTEAA